MRKYAKNISDSNNNLNDSQNTQFNSNLELHNSNINLNDSQNAQHSNLESNNSKVYNNSDRYYFRKNVLIIAILTAILIISSILSIMLGSVSLKPTDILNCIIGKDTTSVAYILIVNVRLPRMIGAIIAGMGLSVAGVILQAVMNNALASPNTIGVNSGAGFFVMLSMIIFPHIAYVTPIAAFVGALLTTLAIYALAYFADSSRTTIVLAGVTVSSFLNAGINTIKLINTDITINLTSFLMGTLSGLTINKILIPCISVIIAIAITMFFAKPLNILTLGDDYARSLGLNVNLTRFILLILSSIMAGCIVSYAGLLSFIGLIVPHICRNLFGGDARLLLPASVLLGGSFVLICDIIGRLIAAPFELPAGIIMSFIGGPFFMYLLLKKKGGRRVNA